jgi:hypothetical protein
MDFREHKSAAQIIKGLFSSYSYEFDDPDGDAFNDALFIKLQKADAEKLKKSRFSGFFKFVPLFFAFALVITGAIYFSFSGTTEGELVSSTSAELDKPLRIVLEYESVKNISDVKVFFNLDRGVRFFSEDEEFVKMGSYIWRGSLKKGINRIPFIVSVVEKGKWNIVTEAVFEGYRHRHRIEFSSSDSAVKVAMYKLESLPL